MTGALGTFEQISALLNSSHCLPTDVLPDDEHKARIRNSNKRAYTYIHTYAPRRVAPLENALGTHSYRETDTRDRDGAGRRTRMKRNGCIIGMRLRCDYLYPPICISILLFFCGSPFSRTRATLPHLDLHSDRSNRF